jgi:plasmid stabilization system protein ParE
VRGLRLQSIAEAEVAEALEWYRQQSATAAQDFLAAVDQTLRRIEQDPESLPLVSKTLRRVLLPRFPYAIYYRVFPDVVTVVGVIHGRRHPRRWRRRGVEPET